MTDEMFTDVDEEMLEKTAATPERGDNEERLAVCIEQREWLSAQFETAENTDERTRLALLLEWNAEEIADLEEEIARVKTSEAA